jgi:ribosomal-protein-alanine N-acetyltransferase
MLIDEIRTSRLVLSCLNLHDVNLEYVNWLNDPEVNQYLEVRHTVVTLHSQKQFVRILQESDHSFILGIYLEESILIGTIKAGPINGFHQTAEIGLMIGAKQYWGNGFGTEAIAGVCDYFSKQPLIRKLNAGVQAPNTGSAKAFLKNDFLLEGKRMGQYLNREGVAVDELLFGKFLR